MSLSSNRCDSIDSLGSIASSSAETGCHRDETAQLQQFGEKMVMRINRMKRQLMDKTVAYLAEQNCRKSAEARLDTELRKVYKLQAHNQEIAHNNARLQQQLRAAKNEVEKLTLENTCLRSAFKGMVEGLNEQLSPTCTSKQQEVKPVEPLPPPQAMSEIKPQPEALLKGCAPQQALPDHLGERMSNLIQGSAEVFNMVAAQGRSQLQPFCSKVPEPGPSTPDLSDASCRPSRSRLRSPHSRGSSESSLDTVLVHPISPTQSSDFCSDPELSVALPPQAALPRSSSLLSTSSLEQLSAASLLPPPVLIRQGSSGDSWLEKLAAEQAALGCEAESPATHAPKPEKRAASRRNGLDWAGPFSSTNAQPSLPGNTTAGSAASGDDINPRSTEDAPSLTKTRSGGIRAMCQRSLSQAFRQGKAV